MSARQLMFAVFDSDGYECSDFVGIFFTESEANEFAEKLRAAIRAEYVRMNATYAELRPDATPMEWMGSVVVDSVVVGKSRTSKVEDIL